MENILTEFTIFVDKWKASKDKRPVKAPRTLGPLPNHRDRIQSTIWIGNQLQTVGNEIVPLQTLCDLYVYVTNSVELTDLDKQVMHRLGDKILDFFKTGQVRTVLNLQMKVLDLINRASTHYGNRVQAIRFVNEYLLQKVLEHGNIKTKRVEFWTIYCVVKDGQPYMAVQKKTLEPFKLDDKFNRRYVHYKRNPTYNYATYTITTPQSEDHLIFVIDGSSEQDISRLFWEGHRGNCVLFPTGTLIEILSMTDVQLENIPREYHFFVNLKRSEGMITYLDSNVGKWKDLQKPYPFIELFHEILRVQQRLYNQSVEVKSLMKKSMSQLQYECTQQGFDIRMYENFNMSNPREIAHVHTCAGVDERYEENMADFFYSKLKTMYYLVAKRPNSDAILAFLYATHIDTNEVHIDLYCKNPQDKETKAARYIFSYAIAYFSERYKLISLEALPMALPTYETYGFIKTPDRDDWVLPVQKSKRSTRRLYSEAERSAYIKSKEPPEIEEEF